MEKVDEKVENEVIFGKDAVNVEETTLKAGLVGAAGEGVEGPALGSLVSMVLSEADLHKVCRYIH